MGKIAIITDSTACLEEEIIKKYKIYVVPLAVNFNYESYKEGHGLSNKEFYQYIKNNSVLPTTSQPAIGEFIELYENLVKEYDSIIAIHLSSGISGTYNTSFSAARMVAGNKIEVIDSELACYGLGLAVIEASKMAAEGKTVSEIVAGVKYIIKNMKSYFVVDDLLHLHRGGRLNTAELLVGSMLKIKPIIYFKDKKLEVFEVIRTRKKALNKVYSLIELDAKDDVIIKASVVNADCVEEASKLAHRIRAINPEFEVNISDFGSVIGTHVGPKSLGVVWYEVKK